MYPLATGFLSIRLRTPDYLLLLRADADAAGLRLVALVDRLLACEARGCLVGSVVVQRLQAGGLRIRATGRRPAASALLYTLLMRGAGLLGWLVGWLVGWLAIVERRPTV